MPRPKSGGDGRRRRTCRPAGWRRGRPRRRAAAAASRSGPSAWASSNRLRSPSSSVRDRGSAPARWTSAFAAAVLGDAATSRSAPSSVSDLLVRRRLVPPRSRRRRRARRGRRAAASASASALADPGLVVDDHHGAVSGQARGRPHCRGARTTCSTNRPMRPHRPARLQKGGFLPRASPEAARRRWLLRSAARADEAPPGPR